IESSRARSLSIFFQSSNPTPPLRVWKSIFAVFFVFSLSASSIGCLLDLLEDARQLVRLREHGIVRAVHVHRGHAKPRRALGRLGGHDGHILQAANVRAWHAHPVEGAQ